MEKQRVRINISTTAKGLSQFDITVEVLDPEKASDLEGLLKESLDTAKKVAVEAGFPPAG